MKKLTYFFLTLFMLIGGGSFAFADDVTFDFKNDTDITITKAGTSGGSTTNGDFEASKGGVTITSDNGYKSASTLSIYKNAYMTLSCQGKLIKKVVFSYTKCCPFVEAMPSGATDVTTKLSAAANGEWNSVDGVETVTFTKGAAGSKTELSKMVVTVEDAVSGDVELIGIEIDGNLTKTTQYVGAAFDYSGLSVMATYSDESEYNVTSQATLTNTLGETLSSIGNDQSVTVTATFNGETASKSFTINVLNKPTALTLSGSYKTEYKLGETFRTAGLVATAIYAVGEPMDVTDFVEFSGYDTSIGGTQTVTVSFEDYGVTVTATYEINVSDPNNNYYVVTDAADLNDGDKLVFLGYYHTNSHDKDAWYVMGAFNSSKYMEAVKLTGFDGENTIIPPASKLEVTLGKDGDYWTFGTESGYISGPTKSSNQCLMNETVDDYSRATVEIDENNKVSVNFKEGGVNQDHTAFGPNLGSTRFACYASISTTNNDFYFYRKAEKKTISSFQYASYVPSMNVVVPEDVKALYLKNEDITGETATLTKVEAGTVVEAGTALVVYTSNAEGETVYFPANANETTTLTDNVLKVASEGIQPIANQDYVFGQIDGKVGFYQFEEGFSVADGTVFVKGDSSNGSNAKGFRITFDNETTGISNVTVKNEANSIIYNLAGQKVDAGYKGIVIKNGKKYINK